MSGGEEKFQGRKRGCLEMRRDFEGEGGWQEKEYFWFIIFAPVKSCN